MRFSGALGSPEHGFPFDLENGTDCTPISPARDLVKTVLIRNAGPVWLKNVMRLHCPMPFSWLTMRTYSLLCFPAQNRYVTQNKEGGKLSVRDTPSRWKRVYGWEGAAAFTVLRGAVH
jgi:hypothetical protein